MKNIKAIQCKANQYDVTAIAVVAGKPSQIDFKTTARDAKAARKFAADKFGVKPTQVLVNFELHKRTFNIKCDVDKLFSVLDDANISYEIGDSNNEE